jgi:hypothetical protein
MDRVCFPSVHSSQELEVQKARANNRSIMISHVEYPVSASALVLQ